MTDSILLEGLTIKHRGKNGEKVLVKNLDVRVPKGRILGIVGESGSGKSLTVKTIMGIQPDSVQATYNQLQFEGKEVTKKDQLPMSMIFQDPMTSLNPLRKIGFHLEEIVKRYTPGLSKEKGREKILSMLEKVGISQPEQRLNQYPFEFSGGMRQRILIAMALLSEPKVLIADEPTTALDVTIQAQILALIKELQETLGLTVLIVSHDFGVIASLCDDVLVMKDGQIVEEGILEEVFDNPQHPYTQQLLQAARFESSQEVASYKQSESAALVSISPTHRVRKEV